MFFMWFHSIFWTNLLTQCQVPASVCFIFGLQKRPKMEVLGKIWKIYRKSEINKNSGSQKGRSRGGTQISHGPWPRLVGHPWPLTAPAPRGSPRDALWTIYSSRQKNPNPWRIFLNMIQSSAAITDKFWGPESSCFGTLPGRWLAPGAIFIAIAASGMVRE